MGIGLAWFIDPTCGFPYNPIPLMSDQGQSYFSGEHQTSTSGTITPGAPYVIHLSY